MNKLNDFYIISAFEAKIKSLINEFAKTTKKTEAKAIYKSIYTLLTFGLDCNIINDTTYQIYIDEAKTLLYSYN